MTAPIATNDSTFDLDPPRRPALTEIGSGVKENHPRFPPDPQRHPRAEEFNHMTKLLEKLGSIVPLARLHITFPGGVPTISSFFAMRGDMEASDFTLVDNGVGDTTIAWTTGVGGKLPPTSGAPGVSIAEDVEIDRVRAFYTSLSGDPAVRVKTKLGATGTDAAFLVTLY